MGIVCGYYRIENEIIENLKTESEKILNKIDGTKINKFDYDSPKYIYSENVKEIYQALEKITEEEIKAIFNIQKMREQNIYNADFFDESNWNFLMLHINTIKNAFRKATEKENGIIINNH